MDSVQEINELKDKISSLDSGDEKIGLQIILANKLQGININEAEEVLKDVFEYGDLKGELLYKAKLNYGSIYLKKSQFDKAEKEILETVNASDLPERLIPQAYLNLGLFYYKTSKYDLAKESLQKCIESKDKEDEAQIGSAYIIWGAMCRDIKEYSDAFEKFENALNIFRKMDYKKDIANTYIWLATVSYDYVDFDSVILYSLKALEIYNETAFLAGIADCYNAIGLASFEISDYQVAEENLLKAYKILNEMNSLEKMSYTTNNLGILYTDMKRFKEALDMFEISQANINKKAKTEIIVYERNKGYCYYKLRQFEKAEQFLRKSIEIQENNFPDLNFISNYYILLLIACRKKDADLVNHCRTVIQRKIKFVGPALQIEYYVIEKKIAKMQKLKDEYEKWDKKIIRAMNKRFEEHTLTQRETLKFKNEMLDKKKKLEEEESKNEQLRKANEKLRQAQEDIKQLERRNSALAIGVTINHEIRQPLTAISGYIDLLFLNPSKSEEKQQKYYSKIQNGFERINNLLNSYQQFDDIEYDDYTENSIMMKFKTSDVNKENINQLD